VFLLLGEAHRLVREDAEAFRALQEAYRTQRDDPSRKEKIVDAALHAMEVPLQVMRKGKEGLALAKHLLGRVSPYVISDVGVAAEQFGAAVRGAHLNVLINQSDAGDVGRSLVEEAEEIAREAQQTLGQLMERLRSELGA
jgi:formiminotetrahydrofolate cyclodeaminase